MAPPPASTAIPPVLPPSVEEAYRRKCIQLRARTQTVSDANDAARIRLLRMRRGIEKMRLERAFLLEQVARRVKPNDESSDGSPEPPPTPKQKPLRVKRGRRAPDFMVSEGLQHHPSQDANTDDDRSQIPNPEYDNRDAIERDRPHFEARIASASTSTAAVDPLRDYTIVDNEIDTSRIGRQLRPGSGFDVFAETLFGPLSVDKRREIARGEFDVRKEIKWKWDKMTHGERDGWDRRFGEEFAGGQSLGMDGAGSAGERREERREDGEMEDGDEERD